LQLVMGMYIQKIYTWQNFPYNVAYAQWATTKKYAHYGLNSCVFFVITHATTNLAYGVNQTWAGILLWGLNYLQHGRFYFGVLTLASFVSSNFVYNIVNFQIEGPTYFFGPIVFIRCTMPLYVEFYFFVWISSMELIFYVSFECCCCCCCCCCVCVCVYLFIYLF
jgi:hypothetical protein